MQSNREEPGATQRDPWVAVCPVAAVVSFCTMAAYVVAFPLLNWISIPYAEVPRR